MSFSQDTQEALHEIPTTSEIRLEAADIALAAKESPDFLAGLAMPEVFTYNWPPLFLALWSWLRDEVDKVRAFQKLALGLPRGFGKTTMVKLFVLYCILFTKRKFILILSVNAQHANNIIADVVDMLDDPNIKAVFGDWRLGIETDTLALKKFGFRGRNIILAGLGAGGSVRGLNIKNARPDVMVFEDIQSREDADSQTVSEDLYKWLLGTAMKAKSPHGCLTLFIANMYPTPHSILKKLKQNSQWVKFITGGINESGESLWEDLQPVNQLLDEFQADFDAGHPEIFYAEVLNDENASLNNLIDISKLPVWNWQEGEISAGNFIVIDPSNDKTNSDAVSIGYFEILDTKPVLVKLIDDRLSPGETIRKALELALAKNCRVIAIEANAYQYSLLYWFNFICAQMGIIGIDAVEVYSGRVSKNSRILGMFKSLKAGEIYFHPSCRAAVTTQIVQFNPIKGNNVDGILDLLTYAPKVVELYGEYIFNHSVIQMQEWSDVKVLENNSIF